MEDRANNCAPAPLDYIRIREFAQRMALALADFGAPLTPALHSDAELAQSMAELGQAISKFEARAAQLSPPRIAFATATGSPGLRVLSQLNSLSLMPAVCLDPSEIVSAGRLAAVDVVVIDLDQPFSRGLVQLRYLRSLTDTPPLLAIGDQGGGPDLRASDLALAPLDSTGSTTGDVLQALGAVLELPRPKPSADVDADIFHQLRMLAKGAGRVELFSRITADLTSAHQRLADCRSYEQASDIRSISHMLIALGGAAGGVKLQHQAEALNLAAHDPNNAALVPPLLDATKATLQRFLDFLGHEADVLA